MGQRDDMKFIRCENCNNIIGCLKGNLVEIKKSGRMVVFKAASEQKIEIRCEKCKKRTVFTAVKRKDG